MYLNDTFGDCVIAAQANAITRMEKDETGVAPVVTDEEVKHEYFVQTGGLDLGLDPIASLNKWRRGWPSGGEPHTIHSWASVVAADPQQVKEASLVGQGLQIAIRLPLSAADQINAGQPWDLVAGPRGEAGSWGGHMVYLVAYDSDGVTVWTWGRRQRATWRWLAAYCDFAALVIDSPDSVRADIDVATLDGLLAEVTK
jgi:hypothetical protein